MCGTAGTLLHLPSVAPRHYRRRGRPPWCGGVAPDLQSLEPPESALKCYDSSYMLRCAVQMGQRIVADRLCRCEAEQGEVDAGFSNIQTKHKSICSHNSHAIRSIIVLGRSVSFVIPASVSLSG